MAPSKPRIKSLGDAAILLQWKEKPTEQLLHYMMGIRKHLSNHLQCEVVQTYNELLLKKPPQSVPASTLFELLDTVQTENFSQRKRITIPVCYGGDYGKDLESLAQAKNMLPDKIIELHTAPEYLVYFIGFLPGFLYLEGLDEQLITARKDSPKFNVATGSVAIGGSQTGIYPQECPGGWHIIGRTPLHIFNVEGEDPSPFEPGDTLKFEQVTGGEYEHIKSEVARGVYKFRTRLL